MASIPPSKSTPDPGSNPRPGRGGHFAAIPSSHLLEVEDELNDLAAALACMPDLRLFAAVMDEIVTPPALSELDNSRDRIARLARKLPKDRRAAAGDALAPLDDESIANLGGGHSGGDLIDLHSALDTIIAVVGHRLRRLAALVKVL